MGVFRDAMDAYLREAQAMADRVASDEWARVHLFGEFERDGQLLHGIRPVIVDPAAEAHRVHYLDAAGALTGIPLCGEAPVLAATSTPGLVSCPDCALHMSSLPPERERGNPAP